MSVLVALPSPSMSPQRLERVLHMIRRRFSASPSIRVVAEHGDQTAYRSLVAALALEILTPEAIKDEPAPRCFVAVKRDDGTAPNISPPPGTPRIYAVETDGRLRILNDWLGVDDDPFVSHHVFNRCTPPTAECVFAQAPYTHLFRNPGMGPYNSFGHRVPPDFPRLSNRGENHKVIAVFGGSACWSIGCYEDEMFTQRLEEKLNEHASETGLDAKFTVLNFGLPGNVVLNEIITYLLHCNRIHPEVVIAHDGFNDLFYGATSEPAFVQDHDMVYQFNLEEWALVILKDWCRSTGQPLSIGDNAKLSQPHWPLVAHNLPQYIIRAYCRRKDQFRDIVEGAGARFVWGFQPYIHSKKHHSEFERGYLEGLLYDNTVKNVYKRMPFLYDKLRYIQPAVAGRDFLDFDTYFSRLEAEENLFIDFCHLCPLGDEYVADAYFQHFVSRVIPDIVEQPVAARRKH